MIALSPPVSPFTLDRTDVPPAEQSRLGGRVGTRRADTPPSRIPNEREPPARGRNRRLSEAAPG